MQPIVDFSFVWRTPNKLRTHIYLFISSILPLISESLLTCDTLGLTVSEAKPRHLISRSKGPLTLRLLHSLFAKNGIRSIFDTCRERYTDTVIRGKETTIIIKNLTLYIESVNNRIHDNIHDYYILIIHDIFLKLNFLYIILLYTFYIHNVYILYYIHYIYVLHYNILILDLCKPDSQLTLKLSYVN